MNDLERQIANLPIPQVSPELDTRISMLFRTHERPDTEQDCFHDSVDTSSIEPLRIRRNPRMTQMLIRFSFVTSAIVLIALTVFLTSDIGIQPVAFGQVKDSVGQVETVSYMCVATSSKLEAKGDEPSEELELPFVTRADIQERVNFLQTKLKANENSEWQRAELNAELRAIQPLLAEGAPNLSLLCWQRISGRDRMRTETVFPKEVAVKLSIFNGREGRHIGRDDEQKQFYILNTFEVANGTESQKLPDGTANFFDDILSIPEKDAERLPEKVIDGKTVIGFAIKFGETLSKTYWVDKDSRLPVRIEELASDGVFLTQTVSTAFSYDAQLDAAIFDVKTPEGFEEHELQTTAAPYSKEALEE